MQIFSRTARCFARAIKDTVYHDGVEHAGYISFLIMLTIFPFLIFFMAIIGVIGNAELGNILVNLILESGLSNFIDALKPRILEITSSPPPSLLTIAIISAIWTASSIFEGLRTILNRAYRVSSPPAYLLRRLWSIAEFLAAITIVLCLTFVLVFAPPIWGVIYKAFAFHDHAFFDFIDPEMKQMRYWALAGTTFLFISYIYYILPSRRQKLTRTFPGALTVVIGWSGFSVLFQYYIANFPQVNFIYGSIAGIIVALLFFYVCSIILIFGAEFNYHLEASYRRSQQNKKN